MTIHTDDLTEELEQDGRVKTAVIGVRYVGEDSSAAPGPIRRQGGWPGDTPFQNGRIQIGINPDWIDDDTVSGGTVAGIERRADFEVVYDPAELAAELLERNYLPPVAFGGEGVSYEPEIRTALFEKLGLEDVGTCPAAANDYREQLAAIAGIDDVDPEERPEDKRRMQQYLSEYTREELKEAVREVREDSEQISLRGGKHEFAEFLAGQEPAVVNEALKSVTE